MFWAEPLLGPWGLRAMSMKVKPSDEVNQAISEWAIACKDVTEIAKEVKSWTMTSAQAGLDKLVEVAFTFEKLAIALDVAEGALTVVRASLAPRNGRPMPSWSRRASRPFALVRACP